MFMSHKWEKKKEMWLLQAQGVTESKDTKICPSDKVAVRCQASGRKRMLNLRSNWRWMDIRIWKWPHVKGKEIPKSWMRANGRIWTSSIPESGKKWPWNCKFSSKYLKLIYGVLEVVLENSNFRKARKMPWATTAPLIYSSSAKLHSCQRILQAFLNNWFF